MGRSGGEDMRELLVRSQMALGMLQTDFAKFLGVSDRTMRRWTDGSVRLAPATLATLTTAVHAKDPALAARIAAAHDHTLEDLGLGLSPEQIVAYAIVRAAADVVGVSPRVSCLALRHGHDAVPPADDAELHAPRVHALSLSQPEREERRAREAEPRDEDHATGRRVCRSARWTLRTP